MTVKRLRERQAEATRELLVTIARELFVEQGFAATAIDEIVQRAGLAKGALYHHFGGKDALFKAVFEVVLDETAEAVLSRRRLKTIRGTPCGRVCPRSSTPACSRPSGES